LRVDWAIVCRYVEINGGLATIVGGGVDGYTVGELPSPLLMTFAMRLLGLPSQDGQPSQVRAAIKILDPMMESTGNDLAVEFPVTPNPSHPAGWEMSVIIPVQMRFEATIAGTYTAHIVVDDDDPHTIAFRVDVPPSE
jgi:hypothetical protein